jgi:hypothetical protein
MFVCPDGHALQGTLERVTGVASAEFLGKGMEPNYFGYTEVDWNSQYTIRRKGKRVWVCSEGDDFTEDLIREEK